MTNTVLYDKAVIYEALDSLSEEQLEALRVFFSNLKIPADVTWNSMSASEYAECLSIAENSSNEEWCGLDEID